MTKSFIYRALVPMSLGMCSHEPNSASDQKFPSYCWTRAPVVQQLNFPLSIWLPAKSSFFALRLGCCVSLYELLLLPFQNRRTDRKRCVFIQRHYPIPTITAGSDVTIQLAYLQCCWYSPLRKKLPVPTHRRL